MDKNSFTSSRPKIKLFSTWERFRDRPPFFPYRKVCSWTYWILWRKEEKNHLKLLLPIKYFWLHLWSIYILVVLCIVCISVHMLKLHIDFLVTLLDLYKNNWPTQFRAIVFLSSKLFFQSFTSFNIPNVGYNMYVI